MRYCSSDVYQHEMPGGQYTNLKFQAASLGLGDSWGKVQQSYAAANRALGDIVKVRGSTQHQHAAPACNGSKGERSVCSSRCMQLAGQRYQLFIGHMLGMGCMAAEKHRQRPSWSCAESWLCLCCKV